MKEGKIQCSSLKAGMSMKDFNSPLSIPSTANSEEPQNCDLNTETVPHIDMIICDMIDKIYTVFVCLCVEVFTHPPHRTFFVVCSKN